MLQRYFLFRDGLSFGGVVGLIPKVDERGADRFVGDEGRDSVHIGAVTRLDAGVVVTNFPALVGI